MAYKEKSPIPVVEGGTGVQTVAAHSLIIGEGTSGFANTGAGTAGQVVVSGGASADPAYVTPSAGSGLSVTANATTLSWGINAPVSVANGGTGDTSLTAYAVLCGGTTTTSAIQSIASVGSSGNILTSNGASALPTFQAPAASSISITGNTGGALTGNAFTFSGGTTGLSFGGSGTTETLTFAGITANGGTVSLATDATTSTVNIGTGAGAKNVNLGSTTSGSTMTIESNGGMNIFSNGGQIQIQSGTGILAIGNDSTINSVSVGSGAAAKVVTIGSSSSGATLTLQSSGTLSLNSNGGLCGFQSGTGTFQICADANANSLQLGTGAAVKTVTLGSTNTTSATTVQSGTGALNITATNGPLTIDSGTGIIGIATDATQNTINIGTGSGAKSVTIGSTNTTSTTVLQCGPSGNLQLQSGTGILAISTDTANTTVNIGTGAAVKTTTLGSTNSTSATTVQSGTGALNITATNGPLTIKSGTGTLAIANDASANTVNIATGAAVKTTTLGSTNSTSATTVQSGTGALNVTSTNGALTMNTGTGQINISTDATNTTIGIGTGLGTKTMVIGSTSGSSSIALVSGSAGFITLANGLTVNPIGIATNSAQPCFNAYMHTSVTGVTGNGTSYPVIFDTKLFDNGTNYSTSTGLFTAPITGKYIFGVNLYLTGISATNTTGEILFNFNSGTAFTISAHNGNIYTQGLTGGAALLSGQFMQTLTSGNTYSVNLVINGSATANIGIAGNATTTSVGTAFWGYLIC